MRVSLAVLLPVLARSEDYVAFQQLSITDSPPPRVLAATVLQHTVAANAALGRYVPHPSPNLNSTGAGRRGRARDEVFY